MKLTKANIARITFPPGKAEHIVYDDDLAGFGLRLHPSGRRTWFVQYRLGQKQRRLKLGTVRATRPRESADACQGRTRQGVARHRPGDGDGGGQGASHHHAEADGRWTISPGMRRIASSLAASPRSSGTFGSTGNRSGNVPLAAIKRAHVAARLAEIARDNGPFAANRARAALSALFTWAIGEGFADDNPVAGTHRPTEEIARDRVLTDAEVALVWRHSGSGDYGAIVRLLLLTACRRDEVGAMAWSEMQGSTWSIPRERTKNSLPA